MAKKLDKSRLQGVVCLTQTPLNKDYTLNEGALRAQIDWLIARGCTGFWMRGFTGEWPQLGMEISKQMFRVYVEHTKGRALVGAGCHGNRLSECVELVNYAEEVGCDFAWITPPMYPASSSNEEIYNHYKLIVENSKSIPLAPYNSGATFVYMQPKLILDILGLSDRFVALKDSHCFGTHQLGLAKWGIPKKVAYFPMSGNIVSGLVLGAAGAMCGPDGLETTVALYKAFKAGDIKKAWEMELETVGLVPHLGAIGRFLAPHVIPPKRFGIPKYRLGKIMGIDLGPPAPPASPASKEDIEAIDKELAKRKVPPA